MDRFQLSCTIHFMPRSLGLKLGRWTLYLKTLINQETVINQDTVVLCPVSTA
ncbi:hypothetical protein BAUCODRAFT_29803 [Baudoinia panamericana UAMH 10762]|uniref:Uncharacterized protein n=1 Tax=Baudoinia panamericana (strain UAMH 10762) TaxID=717646 RepID=M2NJZ6_BAUPA|nr:uncharacterized protein BAUCODRAFT_29803 [Baudoinia panamericana UAMH 10762]EMC99455.1 hypothetical protein BAUCODRAFT_29803 [Baudoinia panamericana UAMH 10762]